MKKVLFIVLPYILIYCENKIKDVNNLTKKFDLPQYISEDATIYHIDSGKVKVVIKTKELIIKKQETFVTREFPKGINAYIYDNNKKIKFRIRSNYANHNSETNIIKLKDSVMAINKNNDSLSTQELTFDNNNDKIYSNSVVKIFKDGQYWKGQEGFESDINFNKYKIKKTFGKVNSSDYDN